MQKTTAFGKLVIFLLLLSPIYAANSSFEFTGPTKLDGLTLTTSWMEINSTLEGEDIQEIGLSWLAPEGNGTNYTTYEDSPTPTLKFNNHLRGEDDLTKVVEVLRYSNNGTVLGANWDYLGNYSRALSFNGVDEYVSAFTSTTGAINPTNAGLGAWVYITGNNSANESQGIVSVMTQNSNPQFELSATISQTQANIYCNCNGGAYGCKSGYAEVNLSTWNYLFCTLVNNGTDIIITSYINGIQANQAVTNITPYTYSANEFRIGAQKTSMNRYFNGSIDSVRIYNRTLSPDEIKLLYQSNLKKINDTNWEFYANLTDLTDGEYSYYLWAKDSNGTVIQSEIMSFTVEATSPEVRINSVVLESVSGRPVLAMNLTTMDANLNYTRITVANSTGAILNSTERMANGIYLIRLEVPYESQYMVTVAARDNAGNSNQSTIIYNVDAAASSEYFVNVVSKRPALELNGVILPVGIAVLIILLLLFALWKHNKKGKKKLLGIGYKGN